MKTSILCLFISVLCVAGEPADLAKNRKVYLDKLQEIEAERNQKVADLTKKYLEILEGVKTSYTKKGDLESAIAVKAEIDGYRPHSLAQTPRRRSLC